MRLYGWVGAIIIFVDFLIGIFKIQFLNIWITPIFWIGYILFMDALNLKLFGKSFLNLNKEGFLWLVIFSCPLWVIFEYYNVNINAWEYVGLPSFPLTVLGMFISFSTIWPAEFETAFFVKHIFNIENVNVKSCQITLSKILFLIGIGVICLVLPIFIRVPHICGLIWLGFILVLDPLNFFLKLPSLLGERHQGKISNFLSFLVGGYICGFLWEFWNHFAGAKWIYHVPFLPHIRIFEMPVLGFLGFGPFGLEVFCMYYTCWFIFKRLRVISSEYLRI